MKNIDSKTTRVLSLNDSSARLEAVRIIKNGEAVGVFNRGVCAIWGNGRDKHFYEEVIRIKGEKRGEKPLATTIRTRDFLELIDKKKIPRFLHGILLNPENLALRIGSLCFIRAPIKAGAAKKLPSYLSSKIDESTYVMQNWDAYGHDSLDNFMDLLQKEGVDFPSVTSMNFSGETEIVDQEEGIEFSQKSGIKIFLTDKLDTGKVKGSFTIISLSEDGLKLIRDGNIPGHVFPYLFEADINTKDSIPAKFPQIEFPVDFFIGVSAENARKKILSFITSAI